MAHINIEPMLQQGLVYSNFFFTILDLFFPEGYCFLIIQPKGRGSFTIWQRHKYRNFFWACQGGFWIFVIVL